MHFTYSGCFYLVYLLTPTLQLTIAVLTGNKPGDTGSNDHIGGSSMQNPVQLETRCQMEIYPNGKIFNCTSGPPSSSPSPSNSVSPQARIRVTRKEKECGSNSLLVGDDCKCSPHYKKFPSSELCVKEEGHYCNFGRNDCNTDMTYMACINNVCACEDSDMWDPTGMRCLGKIGGLCYPGIKDCVLNAHCANIPNPAEMEESKQGELGRADETTADYIITSDIELAGRCECKKGYVESHERLCKKAYGEDCTSSDQCDSLNLVCKEGICSCRNSLQVYDFVSKYCVSLVGAHCSDDKLSEIPCVKYAYCKRSNLRLPEGRCTCMEDMVETRMRTCVRAATLTPSLSAASSQMLSAFLENSRNTNEQSSRVLFSDY